MRCSPGFVASHDGVAIGSGLRLKPSDLQRTKLISKADRVLAVRRELKLGVAELQCDLGRQGLAPNLTRRKHKPITHNNLARNIETLARGFDRDRFTGGVLQKEFVSLQ